MAKVKSKTNHMPRIRGPRLLSYIVLPVDNPSAVQLEIKGNYILDSLG